MLLIWMIFDAETDVKDSIDVNNHSDTILGSVQRVTFHVFQHKIMKPHRLSP